MKAACNRRSWASVAMLMLSACAYGEGTPLSPRDAELPPVQFPEEFALVFSLGYVTDWMPKSPVAFEEMLRHMKRTGINTVHCQ